MSKKKLTFGQVLREARLAKGYTLRKFAQEIGLSPTYVSQVEQDNVDPPTAERVKTMAELLSANSDEWITLAGRIPDDLPAIIQKQPAYLPDLLRETSGMTGEQLAELLKKARKLNEQKKSES